MATPTTLPASFVSGAVLQAAQLNNLRGAFRVLQVVSTTKTDVFTTTSTTYTNVTGLSATITPSATSSKILIYASVPLSNSFNVSGHSAHIRLTGGNSTAYVGDAAGNRIQSAAWTRENSGYQTGAGAPNMILLYLDSPNTTSATTYQVQARIGNAGTVYINSSGLDTNDATFGRMPSTITVMEISA